MGIKDIIKMSKLIEMYNDPAFEEDEVEYQYEDTRSRYYDLVQAVEREEDK